MPLDFERPPQLKLRNCLLLATASGILLTLSFEPFNLYFLAWIAFVPFLTGLRGRKDKMVFWSGTLLGFVFLVTSLFWLRTIHFSVPILLALVWSPLWGLWAWFTKKMWFYLCFPDVNSTLADARKSQFSLSWIKYLILIFASSSIWIFFEWLRFWVFSGFPWNILGVSQAHFSPILPVAAIFGVPGISFILITANLSISSTIESWTLTKKIQWQPLLLPILLCSSAFLSNYIPTELNSAPFRAKIVLVQGNFYPITDREVTQEDYLEQIQTYRNLSLSHAVDKPDLIIWPETPLLSAYSDDPFFQKTIKDIARICKCKVLFGSVHNQEFEGVTRKTNSAFLVDGTGTILERYDKIHLVPYGEYTPMKNLLPSPLWNKLSEIVNMGNLDPGSIYRVFDIGHDVKAGVNICYEDVFPDISREFIRSGADFLITLTNDSWYRQSAGGAQHTAHSVFRAVENGMPLVRCGTTSESCCILPDGSVTNLITGESGSRTARGTTLINLNFNRSKDVTFYYRNPGLFIICSSGIAFLAFLSTGLHFLKRKSRLRQIISGTN